MKIEIWSDIMCPFCYIGKRKFEKALEQFTNKDKVEVIWHSYVLQPTVKYVPGRSIYEFLSDIKGISVEQAQEMNAYVANIASQEGLTFDFDKVIVANSFDAHRLIHMATQYGLQDKAEEYLFSAHFTEGKNISDHETLVELGVKIGLDRQEVIQNLSSGEYTNEVKRDLHEAQNMGIRGVPFFVINRKYGISGAQPSELFLQALQKAWEEEYPQLISLSSDESNNTCVDGTCAI